MDNRAGVSATRTSGGFTGDVLWISQPAYSAASPPLGVVRRQPSGGSPLPLRPSPQEIAEGLISTRTAGREAPLTVTWPMPFTCASFSPRMVEAMSYIWPRSKVSEVSAMIMMGASAGLYLA